MRKFYVSPMLGGFWGGVTNGMASSDYAFDAPRMIIRGNSCYGLSTDKEAIAADVKRAERQFKRVVSTKSQFATAS